ncbi:MAG: AraC family transcriptional regulator [Solobacterium sp.]|nr:AraC family transcriptional regulator [Solobacterium sp.]
MEWLACIRRSVQYIEEHLYDNISAQDIAAHVHMSPFFLQRGFAVMTGYGIAEYIRNRKLYLAAMDLKNSSEKVIDTAYRYGYETPESFAKAFSRFHGCSPLQIRNGTGKIRTFLPLTVSITVHGGDIMKYQITNMFSFRVIGFQKEFSYEEGYREIPKFWDEICAKYADNIYAGNAPENPYEKAIADNCIGEYGICIDDIGDGKFRYLIAGKYAGGEVPEGMMLYEFPRGDWAVFDCYGPIPETLQALNTKIFREWLPGNPDYELSGNANVEWYDTIHGETKDPDYHSAVWIPVKKKENE